MKEATHLRSLNNVKEAKRSEIVRNVEEARPPTERDVKEATHFRQLSNAKKVTHFEEVRNVKGAIHLR